MEVSSLWETLREAVARAPALLLSAAVKGSLVFGVSAVAAVAMRRIHPRIRSLVWLFASAAWLVILASQLLTLPALVEVPNPFRQPSLRGNFSTVIAPRAPSAAAARTAATAATGLVALPPGVAGTPAARPPAAIPPLLAAAWAVGALVAQLRAIVGRVQLSRLARSAARVVDGSLGHVLALAKERMGIRRPVSLLVSARCVTPFTWGEARPFVMLPSGAEGWSAQKARAVLLHELAHVAWHDPLARGLARAACAVFWFVPPAWIAASMLAAEQEMACDSAALEAGARARPYAACLLDFARGAAKPLLLQRTGLAGRRRRELEARIRLIIRRGRPATKGALTAAAALFAALGLVVLGGSSMREKVTLERAWERLAGTWENPSYPGPQPYAQVLKLGPGLVGEDWLYRDSGAADGTWIVKPKRAWTDARGNLYFQFFATYTEPVTRSGVPTGPFRVLFRLDAAGRTLEVNSTSGDEIGTYRETIDPDVNIEHFSYYFTYRRGS